MSDILIIKSRVKLVGFFNKDLVLEEGAEFKLAASQDEAPTNENRQTIWVQRLFPTGLDPTRIEVPASIFR